MDFLLRQRIMEETEHSADEVKQAEEYMRATPLDSEDKPNNNRGKMLELMKVTYKSRRDFVVNGRKVAAGFIFNKYQRLRDMIESVKTIFFILLYFRLGLNRKYIIIFLR